MAKSNIFTDGDSWLNRGLSHLFDILLLGLLTTILCIPVITVGAALTANMDAMLRIGMKKDNKIFKRYFSVFAKNFGKATLIWLIMLVVGVLIGGTIAVCLGGFLSMDATVRVIATIFSIIMGVMYCFTFSYVFALQSRYENKITTTILNALLIGISNFPKSILLTALTVGLGVLGFYFTGLIPLFVILALSFVTFLGGIMTVPILAKLGDAEAAGKDPEEEPEEESEEAEISTETEKK